MNDFKTGIAVCGLNGSGKTTLGRALSESLHYRFTGSENLFFPANSYEEPRSREEAVRLLISEISGCENFVLAAVRGDYGARLEARYRLAVLIDAPREIRLTRIRERSYQKFGSRMLPGGDLYGQEERFFAMAASRPDDYAEAWARTLPCPVLRVDGTKPVRENVALIREHIFRPK